jgi:hypothetical protein
MATTSSGSAKRPAKRRAKRAPSKSTGSSNGRAKPAKKRPAKRAATTSRSSTTSTSNSNKGFTGTVKDVANTAKGPAVAVGAAAAGVAGGLILRARTRRKTVLGMTVPRSLGKGLSGLDAKSVAKSVGHASKRFAKTSKSVSKDLERAGDQAERIGKILD